MKTQEDIVAEAKKRLLDSGIERVCVDSLKNEVLPCSEEKFEELVELVVCDTYYWECPYFF